MARTLPRLTRGGAGSYDRRHIREEDTMAIKVLELHHHGIRVGPTEADADRARTFYQDVLGLSPDPGRPYIPTIPGYWMDVGGRARPAAHARAHRAPRGRLRPRRAEPGRELARPLGRGVSGLRDPPPARRPRPGYAHLYRGHPRARPGLREHRDDAAHALDRLALHRCARNRGTEAAILPRGRPLRQALRELGQRARGEPLPHVPHGDRDPPGR